ncbi:MAG: UDP-N-acetylmuramoyl-L-alanine--D-glutamate ligase [Chitinispirillaceae bacterium]
MSTLTDKKIMFDLRTTFPRRVSIIGAARSGIAAAGYFRSKGVSLFVSDSCAADKLEKILYESGLKEIPHESGNHTEQVLESDLIVLSPGVPSDLAVLGEARKRDIPVWSEMELGFRASDATFLAVTGSTGKSTTVSFLGEALKAGNRESVVAGNIGIPVISVVAGMSKSGWVAAEVSSFQLENIEQFRPKGAAVLNLMKNHLDRYQSEDDYYAAKKQIARNFTKDNYLVVNLHDGRLVEWARAMRHRTNVIFFGHEPGTGDAYWYDGKSGTIRYRFQGSHGTICSVGDMRITGRHNFENACAAAALAKLAGIDDASIGNGITRFSGLPHRLEFAGEVRGVRYYNDSKSTTAESITAAISAFTTGRVYLIAGGRDKGCDFNAVKDALRAYVGGVCLIGEAAGRMEAEWQGIVPLYRCSSLEEAVTVAVQKAGSGDAVVLSPGCSSFDMFADYKERGERFKKIVAALAAGGVQ